MKMKLHLRFIMLALIASIHSASAQTFTLLHSFTNGVYPPGSLIQSDGTLYGMGQAGGIFKMNINGSGYTSLHSFTGYPNDGAAPPGSLTLDGSTLYGMTQQGGTAPHNLGIVFKINTDGSGYTNLHSFAGGANDGATPYGSLMLSGSTLYGMTYYGGTSNYGVVFTLSNLPPELPQPPASLTINYINNHAIVWWPASVSGCTLQTNSDLATGTWGNYIGPVINNTVTNSPANGNLFFRLLYP